MSWHTLPPAIQAIATQHLTQRQLAAWQLDLAGHGTRRIAIILDISRSTAAEHLTAAYRNLRTHGVRQDASGHYHLEDTT